MFRQPKFQSIIIFLVALLNISLSLHLISLDWYKWQVTTDDVAREGYRIEVYADEPLKSAWEYHSPHKYVEHTSPREYLIVHSPKGICADINANWIITDLDIKKEHLINNLFSLASILSVLCVFVAFVNLLRCYKKTDYSLYFSPFGLFLFILVIVRLLGPVSVGNFDFSLFDYDCTYLVNLKAELVSVNQTAIILFAVIVLVGITVVVSVRLAFLKENS